MSRHIRKVFELARLVVVVVSIVALVNLVGLGIAGLQDGLMDATPGQNHSIGVTFLLTALIPLGILWIAIRPWFRGRRDDGNGG